MDNDVKKLVNYLLICTDSIESYIGFNRNFTEYDTNLLLQDAVERNLITIGKAMNSLLKRMPSIALTNSRKIVDTRNSLTRGYDNIENLQIWNVII